jgi:hypothetical protein
MSRSTLACSLLLAAVLAGCGSGGDGGGGASETTAPDPAPTTGALTVTTSTSGAEADADGYTVTVDGGSAQAIASAGALVVPSLERGTHAVELGGVAANCSVEDGATHTASVTAGDTTSVTFAVNCHATTGALAITVATTGDDLDADGYTLILADTVLSLGTSTITIPLPLGDDLAVPTSAFDVIGDSTLATIATNGTTTATALPPGSYAILLDGLAAGCAMSNGFWVIAPVAAGDTTAVAVPVECHAPATDVHLLLATSTALVDGAVAPDGYTVAVNFGDEEAIGLNDHDVDLDARRVSAGPVAVWLRGVPANCTVSGGNVRKTEIVTTALGDFTGAGFNVTCTHAP